MKWISCMYTYIPSLLCLLPTHPFILPFYIITAHYQSSSKFSLNIKYLGWGNSSVVAQRISWVQSRRWWQGELARPNGPCCLKMGDKLGRESWSKPSSFSQVLQGLHQPICIVMQVCRSPSGWMLCAHNKSQAATTETPQLSAPWELTSCCESALNSQSWEGEASWDDVFFDMDLGDLFYVVWVCCVGGGTALFSWLGCLRWGCERG